MQQWGQLEGFQTSLFEEGFPASLRLSETASEQADTVGRDLPRSEEGMFLLGLDVSDASISSPFSACHYRTMPQIRKLQQFYKLGADWDGQGADAPDRDVIKATEESARWLIENRLFPTPEPMISADGEVGLFWSNGDRYAELSFEREGKDISISVFSRDELGCTSFFDEVYSGCESLSAEMLGALEDHVG